MGVQLQDLPTSEFIAIVKAKSPDLLDDVIRHLCAGDGFISHSAAVHGGSRSMRLLASKPFAGSIAHQSAMDAWKTAQELVKLAETEARYDPPHKDGHEKAWEVRRIHLDDVPAILVQTTWVS